ncbi:Alpha-N-acetylgalactosaminidase [Planctomycetes bacterium Pla163]|uniref:Alpha-N-acetylgalactosaminidase n=1 Tax=Rohdeia mirabilis TaxID=2528008 RepID=A0A518D1S8_9BACT|nr:Alpha-N-acetylgalactosaminidase [Planctomycetes bacterium Pla163]
MLTRRTFVTESLLASAAAAAAARTVFAAPVFGPVQEGADPVRVAVLGVRGRGRGHIAGFNRSPDARVVAICDPDEGVIAQAQRAVPDARYERDLRRIMDDDSIDAVSIATPNHWHSLAAIWALDAGKHVYVEKPVSQSLEDGRALVAAARRSGRVIQSGMQSRSHAATRDALAFVREGGIGALRSVNGLCYKRRQSIGKVAAPTAPPATLDFDLWTGPAALGDVWRTNLHYDWHWVWNTGNGDIGNQGVHQMDIARWGAGIDGFPRRVRSFGGRLGYDDDGETPNSQVVAFDCDEAPPIVFEVRGLVSPSYRGANTGVVFHGERGYVVSSSYNHVPVYDHDGVETRAFDGGSEQDHYQNFLDAVKAGDPARVNADAQVGHVSAGWCHLANLSHRLGSERALASDLDTVGGLAGEEAVARMRLHLVENALPADLSITLGAELEVDAVRGRVVGPLAEAAAALDHRAPRAGFELPLG